MVSKNVAMLDVVCVHKKMITPVFLYRSRIGSGLAIYLPTLFQLERSASREPGYAERGKQSPAIRTAIERSSSPLDSIFVFLARHLLGPLARKKRPDKRRHGVLAIHCLLGSIEGAVDHVFPAGLCDARKALEARAGEPVRDKTYLTSREHASLRWQLVLRTCWEDVDQETAGDDGILDKLVRLA